MKVSLDQMRQGVHRRGLLSFTTSSTGPQPTVALSPLPPPMTRPPLWQRNAAAIEVLRSHGTDERVDDDSFG